MADIKKKNPASSCETCVFYDWDEDMQENICTAMLDEDEYYRMMSSSRCPFYKYHNEYKTVQKQN